MSGGSRGPTKQDRVQPADPWWGSLLDDEAHHVAGHGAGGSTSPAGASSGAGRRGAVPTPVGRRTRGASSTSTPVPRPAGRRAEQQLQLELGQEEQHDLVPIFDGDLRDVLRERARRRTITRRRRSAANRVALAIRQRVARSERLRRITRRALIFSVILVAFTCSVGVITLNNLVIRRSAELGKLEDKRRQLRTENALIAGEIAQLSAPPRVARIARKKLGMQPAQTMPPFIYLDPANRPVTDAEVRRRLARAEAAARARREARTASAGDPEQADEPSAEAVAP